MSNWAAMEDFASGVVDETFGENFEFRPMTQITVNDPVCADPMRSVIAVRGIYGAPSSEVQMNVVKPSRTKILGGDGQTIVSMSAPRISAEERNFTAGELPKAGDRFLRVATNDVYSVMDVQPDGQGRWVYVCSHVTKEAA